MRLIYSIVFVMFGTTAQAQQFNLMHTCQQGSPYAQNLFAQVIAEARSIAFVPPTVFCRNAMVPNAYAWSFRDQMSGQMVYTVHYNPGFMTQMDVTLSNEWAQIAVMAHEIGHIVEFAQMAQSAAWQQQFTYSTPWSRELFADSFAGKILARMGADPDEISDALLLLFSPYGSPTHPDTVSRLQAMHAGFAEAGGDTSGLASPNEIATQIFEELSRW